MTESDWSDLNDAAKARNNGATAEALRNQAVQTELKDLRQHVIALEQAMKEVKAERESLMKYGLMSLGAAVLGMGVYIWHLIADRVLK